MRKLYFIFFAALVAVVSCSKENPTPAPSSLEMVDLGLSVKWASCNVGATKPEEYGTYFAWGDVTGQTWDGSKWSGAGFSTAPKYEVDANGNLKPEYDAAHVNLGGDWRMPTKEEQQALIDNCTSTWVINYNGTGVAGRVFTSKINGNSIFMPAGGYGYGENIITRVNNCGFYWSSTFGHDDFALRLRFYQDSLFIDDGYRESGRSIRAVADKSTPDPSVVIDLSAYGTANCYNVPFSGSFKFKATVKGNSTESVGTPASAEVLWESFGTSVAPSKGDIVKNVSLESGYVKFSTPASLANGNAVIAVKDASGSILWSWHIWVCKDFYPSASAQVYKNNAGMMMDRNLGATSATPGDVHALGLLYQWGRKDPFLGSSSISSAVNAASTLSWPSAEQASAHLSGNNTLSYSISHPTTFIINATAPYDWYCINASNKNDNLWKKTKSMYDPCPAGWQVPDGGDNGVWATALGSSSVITGGPWDSTNYGMDFGSGNGKSSNMQLGSASTIWYAAAGCRSGVNGSLYYVGIGGLQWTCTTFDYYAYEYYCTSEGKVGPSGNDGYRASSRSVRCIKD